MGDSGNIVSHQSVERDQSEWKLGKSIHTYIRIYIYTRAIVYGRLKRRLSLVYSFEKYNHRLYNRCRSENRGEWSLWLELGLSDLAIHARRGKFIGLVSSAKYYLTFKSLEHCEETTPHRGEERERESRPFEISIYSYNYTKIITRRTTSSERLSGE